MNGLRIVSRLLTVLALFLILLQTATGDAERAMRIYVSPGGNDANPGTAARPLRILMRARDLVRERGNPARFEPDLAGSL